MDTKGFSLFSGKTEYLRDTYGRLEIVEGSRLFYSGPVRVQRTMRVCLVSVTASGRLRSPVLSHGTFLSFANKAPLRRQIVRENSFL